MTTIKEVAARAGVSSATVSHVINNTRYVSDVVKQRVQESMNEMGYRPNALARSLRQGKTQTLGLILPDSSNPFYAELGHALEKSAFLKNYNVILCNTDSSIAREHLYFDLLLDKQVDGIILNTEEKDPHDIKKRLPVGYPIVLVDRDFSENIFDTVLTDNILGGYLATRYLIELGHRRIACVTGPMSFWGAVNRLQGYQKALAEFGLPEITNSIYYGDFTAGSGHEAAHHLLKLPELPTAVFVGNDMMAIGFLRSSIEMNFRIPEDISIVGFDNLELSMYMHPTITSFAQPKEEIGEKTIQLLLERIENPKAPPQRILIPPRLIIRESTSVLCKSPDIITNFHRNTNHYPKETGNE
jgi:LacI family transcriptional regulator